jgi:hypothetical protein
VHDNTKYLVIRVNNIGHSNAYDCRADAKVIIPTDVDKMKYPSDNVKALCWSREEDLSDVHGTRNILGHHWDYLLYVVFSNPNFPNILVVSPTSESLFVLFLTRERVLIL